MQHISTWVFDQIRQALPPKTSLANIISEVLDINVTNCYKRIRGEVNLTADELIKLVNHFDLSIDEHLDSGDATQRIIGIRPPYIEDNASVLNYLTATTQLLAELPGSHHSLYYSARDIPLFYYFFSEALTRFKYLVWLRGANYRKNRNLKMEDINLAAVNKSSNLLELYGGINSVELWTERTLFNQLVQMESLLNQSVITSMECLDILTDLKELFKFIKSQFLDTTTKRIIFVDYLNMANNALVKSEKGDRCFLSFSGINYVTSTNINLAKDMEHWFQQQVESGTLLNGNESKKDSFFRKVEYHIDKFEARIRALWVTRSI